MKTKRIAPIIDDIEAMLDDYAGDGFADECAKLAAVLNFLELASRARAAAIMAASVQNTTAVLLAEQTSDTCFDNARLVLR